ncbi:hypothetical protein DVH05_000363 [Phytophthora capsici]|nr:hypothetical protein DVH05_000363 [Phytophthora capsici]|eukprot:jgi/Phyca11/20202/fgenesh1_pg.PHYCAscaffold_59_\
MRLTYIMIVATAAILACCDGASAVSDSKRLTVPLDRVQTGNNANRFLRVHHDEEEEEEEERTGPQFIKSLSEKFAKAAETGNFAKTVEKLTRSKSLNGISKVDDVVVPGRAGKTLTEVLKIDDVAYLKAAGKWPKNLDDIQEAKLVREISTLDDQATLKLITKENAAEFKKIEDMGFNPDGMLKRMKQLSKNDKDYFDLVLLKHYTQYYMAKHPTWASSL